MHQIDALLALLEHAEHLDKLRRDIFTLIRERLDARRDNLDHWATLHFSNAIGTLSLNVNSFMHQPSPHWLRLCLHDLRLAICHESVRDTASSLPVDHGADQLMDYAGLRAALDEIGAKPGIFPSTNLTPSHQRQPSPQHETSPIKSRKQAAEPF